ncbi:MAG: fructosamine kinase family protein [Bacillaceae bacterium]|nr:fructosamine kinase family protein [Bacillaceae bacterium]
MGEDGPICGIRPVSGGSISRAYQVETGRGTYFVKINTEAPPALFTREAEGLTLLKKSGAVRVPEVYHVSLPAAATGYIVMEWVEGSRTAGTEEELGRNVACLHQVTGPDFGLEQDNYIGRLPQPNGWDRDWITFLREKRLGYQAKLAENNGYFPANRRRKMDHLLASLDRWIDVKQVKPSLLHGDLWGGNWMTGSGGMPYLIDPAVFYGDREFELAFTELFGGYSSVFYQAYREVYPLSPGYEERKEIYQLYYLLVHLNLFGESYGSSVDRILNRYVG